MRIIIVGKAFYPTMSARSYRATELAVEFSRLGHEVIVYEPPIEYDYTDFEKEHKNITIKYTRDISKSFFYSSPLFLKLFSGVLGKLINYPYIHFLFDIKKTFAEESDCDLLISLAVPHSIHWGVNKLLSKRKIAKTWIADCGDPFMKSGTDAHPPFYFKWIEKSWCKKCDYITVPTESSYLGYYEEFFNKIKVIPQAFNFDETPIDNYKPNKIPTFCYAGGLMKGIRDPFKLLDYLATLKTPFKFIVYGGDSINMLEPYQAILGDKLEIKGAIPRKDIIMELSRMDFLINIGNGTNIQTPSKLIDYSIAKRPIITIETNDIKEDILNEFLAGNYEHKDPEIDITKYDIHIVAQQFLKLCK